MAEPTPLDEWNHRPFLLLSLCCARASGSFSLKELKKTQVSKGKRDFNDTEWARPGSPAHCPFGAGLSFSEGLDKDSPVNDLRHCSSGCLINTYSYLLTFWKQNQEPLKGQSAHCAYEPWGIFRTGPKQWCGQWTLIPRRERSLCADLALGKIVVLENFDVVLPCMSFPSYCGSSIYQVM